MSDSRWILAFDATCGTCRQLSNAVAEAYQGRLEVLPLASPDVEEWRAAALGPNTSMVPTLLRVNSGVPRAWTGPAMGIRLARMLGLRSTARVLVSLGRLKRLEDECTHHTSSKDSGGFAKYGRLQFLRLSAGAMVAGRLIGTGRVAAFGDQRSDRELKLWLKAHANNLPARYDDVVTYAMPYRRAIFTRSTPEVGSALWVTHVERYRVAHPALDAKQVAVIEHATRLFKDRSLFAGGDVSTDDRARLDKLKRSAIDAFGVSEARSLVATLGPEDNSPRSDCECFSFDDWCITPQLPKCLPCCNTHAGCGCGKVCCCGQTDRGCGSAWLAPCNGFCGYPPN